MRSDNIFSTKQKLRMRRRFQSIGFVTAVFVVSNLLIQRLYVTRLYDQQRSWTASTGSSQDITSYLLPFFSAAGTNERVKRDSVNSKTTKQRQEQLLERQDDHGSRATDEKELLARQVISERDDDDDDERDSSEVDDDGDDDEQTVGTFGVHAVGDSSMPRLPSEAHSRTKRLCTREEIRQGEWVHVRLSKPPYKAPQGSVACHPLNSNLGYYDTYQWTPHGHKSGTCEFTNWNATLFCELTAGKTILMQGDSLTWEQFQSLVRTMGKSTKHVDRRVRDRNIPVPVCHGNTLLVYRRDNILVNITLSLQEHFPDILILNKGAHYERHWLHREGLERNVLQVQEWKEECKRRGKPCQCYWRTTVPGHANCQNFTAPVNDLAAMEAYIANEDNYDVETDKYHWQDYQKRNEIALQMMEDAAVDMQVMDAYYVNILRPDGHNFWDRGDCLHNCYPGKMDVYNPWLLHFLRMQKEKEDNGNVQNAVE